MPVSDSVQAPSLIWGIPFLALLICVAALPLSRRTQQWWHTNSNKLLVSLALGGLTLIYYALRGYGISYGGQLSPPGWRTVTAVLNHALVGEYTPFISLLFSLYVISGGIRIKGDLPAHPSTNTLFLAVGGLLASAIGTTGASMLLIRPLLNTNTERRRVTHTIVFFIFIVSNAGGALLPVGDPPLFLGYLHGVPFLWTLGLWKPWALCLAALLATYYVWDRIEFKKETPRRVLLDETVVEKLSVEGSINTIWLLLVVVATVILDPSKQFPGTRWTPPHHLREFTQLALVALSLATTVKSIRAANQFNYEAIAEVAFLFVGIFLCMQTPLEILDARGAHLGLDSPAKFFWATGALSSLLDNAPTYLVFFETANAMTHSAGQGVLQLFSGHFIREDFLVGISLGAVFMGAYTYIGNGPNFMVKSIAEANGVRMPSFFGFLGISLCVLTPLWLLVAFLFL